MKSIIVDSVSKSYRRRGRVTTLAEIADKGIQALKGQRASVNTQIHALKDISFEVAKGEILGIIGPNGAGKTTILSLIAGVTRPTRGKVDVIGRIAPLIALGAGFHPELSGRENIYLNGIILGMTKKDVQKRFDAIVEFSEIGEFLNTPVKRYSSGMHARLGFATAIHIDPEILLVDEVLAVGDLAFQDKCIRRIKLFKEKGVTSVFVSHNLEMVRRVCDRVILLNDGEIKVDGTIDKAINAYFDTIGDKQTDSNTGIIREAEIVSVELYKKRGLATRTFKAGDSAIAKVRVRFNQDVKDPEVGFFIHRRDSLFILSTGSKDLGIELPLCLRGDIWEVKFSFQVNLLHGSYHIGAEVRSGRFEKYLDHIRVAVTMNVFENYAHGGVAHLAPKCSVIKVEG